MKIVMPGGSGQVGAVLGRAFQRDGHDVVVLSRRPIDSPWRVVSWDGATLGTWSKEIDGCDVVINLAGRSVNCRYTAANRKEILASRVSSTRVDDFVATVAWLIAHDEVDGAVNVCAPKPLPQAEFMRALRQAAGVPIGLPATKLMAAIGAVFMQTETELILKSRRVVPGGLLDGGFAFKYPDWRDAAVDLCGRWKH